MPDVPVSIPPSSPLLLYTPERNGLLQLAWIQDGGGSRCQGAGPYAVQLDGQTFSTMTITWSASGSYQVSAGVDGSLQDAPVGAGGVTLTAGPGKHDVRLEVACTTCTKDQTFALTGVTLGTTMSGSNATLDDAGISYQGFTSSGFLPGIQQSYYRDTVSYTTAQGAAARFSFDGSAVYVFGLTGPTFGMFAVQLDGQTAGTYNASTTTVSASLLFVATGLQGTHEVVLTNEEEGGLLAIDYVVAVSSATETGPSSSLGPTAVFPGDGSQSGSSSGGGNGSAGAAIGGAVGALAGLLLLWIWWRYYRYKKAGGQGGCFEAMFGAWGRRKEEKAKEEKFKLWPMLSFKPKYAT